MAGMVGECIQPAAGAKLKGISAENDRGWRHASPSGKQDKSVGRANQLSHSKGRKCSNVFIHVMAAIPYVTATS